MIKIIIHLKQIMLFSIPEDVGTNVLA